MEISARLNPISYEKPLSKRTIPADIAEVARLLRLFYLFIA